MPLPTELNEEELKRLFFAGMSVEDIRREMKTSWRVISRTIAALDLSRPRLLHRQAPKGVIGSRFGALVVTGFEHSEKSKLWYATVLCDCGNSSKETLRKLEKAKRLTCGVPGCPQFHAIRQKHGKLAAFTGFGEIYGSRWAGWRIGAEKRGLTFEVTVEEGWGLFEEQQRRCALSGIELTFGNSINRNITASLDRIDSSKGYSLGNVQWVHKRINLMKSSLSDEEFRAWCHRVTMHSRGGTGKNPAPE